MAEELVLPLITFIPEDSWVRLRFRPADEPLQPARLECPRSDTIHDWKLDSGVKSWTKKELQVAVVEDFTPATGALEADSAEGYLL